MQLIPVDPATIPNFKEGRRGRVSYPILKMFLESGADCSQLDRTGMQQSMQSLNSCLTAYVKSHNLPIKIFTSMGQIYLARTDLEDEKIVESEATPIDDDEVEKRFAEEKDQAGK